MNEGDNTTKGKKEEAVQVINEKANDQYNTERSFVGKSIDEVQESEDEVYTPVNHQFDNLTEISNGEDEMREIVSDYKTEVLHEDSYANKELEEEAIAGAHSVQTTQNNINSDVNRVKSNYNSNNNNKNNNSNESDNNVW